MYWIISNGLWGFLWIWPSCYLNTQTIDVSNSHWIQVLYSKEVISNDRYHHLLIESPIWLVYNLFTLPYSCNLRLINTGFPTVFQVGVCSSQLHVPGNTLILLSVYEPWLSNLLDIVSPSDVIDVCLLYLLLLLLSHVCCVVLLIFGVPFLSRLIIFLPPIGTCFKLLYLKSPSKSEIRLVKKSVSVAFPKIMYHSNWYVFYHWFNGQL